jgi:alpha-tubulin suppressor-like RCC1 family protein
VARCILCTVTEKGELFTWGATNQFFATGHGGRVWEAQHTLKRVEGMVGTRIVAVAIGHTHTLAADENGVVWAFGERRVLGLAAAPDPEDLCAKTPTPIPTLRVCVLKSP